MTKITGVKSPSYTDVHPVNHHTVFLLKLAKQTYEILPT